MITAYDLHKNLIVPSDGIRMKVFFEDYPLIEEQGTSLIIPEVNLLKGAEKLQLFLADVPILVQCHISIPLKTSENVIKPKVF